tara:strand:+ start:31 stop:633 length:603 start_codon:yes stop_codon:yes gene_type:complete
VCAALPVIGAVANVVGGVMQTAAERKAIAEQNRNNRIASNNRNLIKIAKNKEENVQIAKTNDSNFAGYLAAVGSQDLNAYKMRSELTQSNVTALKKAFSSSAGMETYGNLGRKLQTASIMEAGQFMSNQASAFVRGIEASEVKKDSLAAQYNSNIRTGNPLILETAPPKLSKPSMLGGFLNAGVSGLSTYSSLKASGVFV